MKQLWFSFRVVRMQSKIAARDHGGDVIFTFGERVKAGEG